MKTRRCIWWTGRTVYQSWRFIQSCLNPHTGNWTKEEEVEEMDPIVILLRNLWATEKANRLSVWTACIYPSVRSPVRTVGKTDQSDEAPERFALKSMRDWLPTPEKIFTPEFCGIWFWEKGCSLGKCDCLK